MGTTGVNFPVWVPDSGTDLVPLAGPFTTLASSVAAQLDRVSNKARSIVTRSDVITTSTGWVINYQRLVIGGEIIGSVYLEVKRTGAAITVPTSGNITNTQVGTMVSGYNAQAQVPLVAGATGRGAHGHILNNGAVYLDSVVGTGNINTNDVISLGGTYILDNPNSSGL